MSSIKLKKRHIEGNHPNNKPVNHQSEDFQNTRYKSLRESGSKPTDGSSSTRVPGTRPGQTKTVTGNIAYNQTGSSNQDQFGSSNFMTTGQRKNNNLFSPQHLDGKLEQIGEKQYVDTKGDEYSEVSSSESRNYHDSEHSSDWY